MKRARGAKGSVSDSGQYRKQIKAICSVNSLHKRKREMMAAGACVDTRGDREKFGEMAAW